MNKIKTIICLSVFFGADASLTLSKAFQKTISSARAVSTWAKTAANTAHTAAQSLSSPEAGRVVANKFYNSAPYSAAFIQDTRKLMHENTKMDLVGFITSGGAMQDDVRSDTVIHESDELINLNIQHEKSTFRSAVSNACNKIAPMLHSAEELVNNATNNPIISTCLPFAKSTVQSYAYNIFKRSVAPGALSTVLNLASKPAYLTIAKWAGGLILETEFIKNFLRTMEEKRAEELANAKKVTNPVTSQEILPAV